MKCDSVLCAPTENYIWKSGCYRILFYFPPLSNSHFSKTHNYHRPSWEANSSSGSQKILFILRSPKVHYRVHNSPSLFINRSQINPVHAYHPLPVSSTSILSSNLYLGLSLVFSSGLHHQNYVRISPLPSACYMPRPTSSFHNSDVGEAWWYWSSSLCIFLHFPVISSLLVTNVFFSTLPWIPSAYVLPSMWQTKFHTHTKQTKL